MTRTVTIKTPPTFFVTDGPDLTFDLPLVPRANFSGGAGMLVYLAIAGLVGLWVLSFPASWILAAVLGWSDFRTDKLLFGLFFLAWVLAIISPAIEAGLKVAFTLFSRRPVLEIRPEGLIDRRALKRLVRWRNSKVSATVGIWPAQWVCLQRFPSGSRRATCDDSLLFRWLSGSCEAAIASSSFPMALTSLRASFRI